MAGLVTTVRNFAMGIVENPSAVMVAALVAGVPEAEILRSFTVPVCSVMTPPLIVDGVVAPVKASILDNNVLMLSVTLI